MFSKKRIKKEYKNYKIKNSVSYLTYGEPRIVEKSGPSRIFTILTAITTAIVGVYTATSIIVNGNINGRYAEYAGKDSVVYEIDRTFDEEEKSLEFAIAILDSPMPEEEEEPETSVRDDGPISQTSVIKEIWTPTRINLPKNIGYSRILGNRGMSEPNVIQNMVEGASFRYTYKEYSFMSGRDLLDFKDGYGYNIDTNECYEVLNGYPYMNSDGKNRNTSYAAGLENEDLFTYLQINGEYFFAGKNAILKYIPEERKFYVKNNYPVKIGSDKLIRSSAKDGYIYIAYGDTINPSSITVLKYDTKEQKFSSTFEISAMGQGIDLYAGFVVDDKERLLFNKVSKVSNSDYESSIVSCTLDGKWEQRSEFGTLISESSTGILNAFITLEQTDYGIVARSGDGILFYSFDSGSVSTVFNAADAYIFRADGPYVYAVPCPEVKKNNATSFIKVHYFDWGDFTLKRANVLTGDVQTIDLSAYYDVIDFVPITNISNTCDSTDKPTDRPTCEANANVSQPDLQRKFSARFICNMNQNKCVFGYYDNFSKKEGNHFVVAEIDDAGNVTCCSY